MNPEDVRKLLGGYATGSLSEAERKLLLDAALEDQELFDELAGEHVLKEILEEPGARQRLLAALEQKSAVVWWSRPWPWMTAAVTVAIAIIVVVSQRIPPPPQEIAQVMKTAEPVAAPPPPQPAPAPRKVSPPARETSADAIAEARADKAEPQALADAQPAAPPQSQRQAVGAVSGFAARGGRAENLAASAVSVFGFNYTVRADGVLEIVPASPGFLSVMAGANVLLPSASVAAGTPVRVQIPADAASLAIGFYAMQGNAAAPVRRDGTSGTVTDQDPPNGRISIQLFLTPRTQ
ncbi:MAG TPA: hypothetical protein VLN48_16625 [Bryobacteraceae bacterium]|nr:hypothetical protein [Bryobacteraceae bacterium]